MKFLLLTLITHQPDPVTGAVESPAQRLRRVVDSARLAEEFGYDGFAVGERHEDPFISSAPPVVLSHIAAVTSRIALFTGVTTLSLLDPVRAFEDYSTLDNLSGGRLELIIGKGNGAAQAQLFHVTAEDQWDRNREGYELFRLLWGSDSVTWSGRFRPALTDAKALPRPLQPRLRIWHGSATSRDSVDLAARYGDPLFSANVTYPLEPYAELVEHYRDRWAAYGHDPADALVGAGTAGFYVTRDSQDALRAYRPIFEARQATARKHGVPIVFDTLEDFAERSSALIGSPQQVSEKVHRYHERFGHEVIHLSADSDGLTDNQHRESLELFQSEVAPPLRQRIPSRALGALRYGTPVAPSDAATQGDAALWGDVDAQHEGAARPTDIAEAVHR
ncbi:LLM class flavin-dependent oxidoreductase [Nocardia mexicana]|uniref:Alkanesulfonate monooxygenase SsuD/methylene tetrahydromethanopterin reductase-like flavin-dependent oxidoreductase (Luciferase family) n=1 Tax=Nocardia mexicana TaxID=279262 RepID=A0A370GPJ3_9NOCA|nr:LLM class flavin-dependent oxidoreductase [Nocardia mexicana]RDI43873.1 alkanesulfonate monooxygenase SsuD/methylene tetrahydromethanopterin reductase-like flavin-dependent oxidoreductase (luciferase family) [Nocardia mexicana]